MVSNGQKLNQDKTELLLISSGYHQSSVFSYLQVGDEKVCPNESKRDLGVYFDQHAMMHIHVKKVCQAAYYHLQDLSNIRRYLSQDTNKILIYTYITLKLDNCNSLLYGLPTYRLYRMQLQELLLLQRKLIKLLPHERGRGNSRQLCKPSTSSRACITVSNSPNPSSVYIRLCKHKKKVFYCFYKITSSKIYNAGKDKNSFY